MIANILLLLITTTSYFLMAINILILIEVILSWLTLLGIHIVIGPLRNITQPIYAFVQKYIPTRFGTVDFTPIIIYMAIIYIAFPILQSLAQTVQAYITF